MRKDILTIENNLDLIIKLDYIDDFVRLDIIEKDRNHLGKFYHISFVKDVLNKFAELSLNEDVKNFLIYFFFKFFRDEYLDTEIIDRIKGVINEKTIII